MDLLKLFVAKDVGGRFGGKSYWPNVELGAESGVESLISRVEERKNIFFFMFFF